ncbi:MULTISPECIES: hypothetical protein [unclassified Streptomyces]|uniref:hypothetical protein n=1 Tax=unclassified Streptomyces TaxID=2593676 RepID=UPI00331E7BBE
MRRAHRLAAGLLAAGALLTATGCAQSVDPIERLGRKAAQWVGHPDRAPGSRAERHGPSVRCPLGVRTGAGAGEGGSGADATPRSLELALRLTEC